MHEFFHTCVAVRARKAEQSDGSYIFNYVYALTLRSVEEALKRYEAMHVVCMCMCEAVCTW